jgi:uncharacterized protein (TIGR03083 family)
VIAEAGANEESGAPRIRPAAPADHPAIRALQSAAFGGNQVPRLVEALRASVPPSTVLELVAEDSTGLVGHVLVTPIGLETEPGVTTPLACLSPLGVRPDRQRRGIGAALVRTALAEAAIRGEPGVVLEGDPGYYARFGFVPASRHGLRRPSERTPEPAFQVAVLGDAPRHGRALYPATFWDADAVGLPYPGVPWLDELEQACRFVEEAVGGDVLRRPVPACPGWNVGELLRHLGAVERVVATWVQAGRRPRSALSAPEDGDVRSWFAVGWRRLQEVLDAAPADSPAATWCPWDATLGFWRRRQAHEHLVHAIDVAQALGLPQPRITDSVALDGVDEVLRLWLGTQLGRNVGGRGDVVRLVAGGRSWTVGLHAHVVEVHDRPVDAEAVVRAEPAVVYRWLWGRGSESDLHVEGHRGAAHELREFLAGAMA